MKCKNFSRFVYIKFITKGYLSPRIYREIYNCSVEAKEGYMIDIGPAQGGSSISLCLGIRESGKVSSKVFSIEKGRGSRALFSTDDLDRNKNILTANIERFRLSKYSTILMGDVAEVHGSVGPEKPISLMFIDADGALDRDFRLFYNRVLPGAPIIIDDYSIVINRLARENYLRWKTKAELDSYVQKKSASYFYELCPLGKEYTTYRFINYLLVNNFIEQGQVIGSTFFGRKTKNPPSFEQKHALEMLDIRFEIEEHYYQLNPFLEKDISKNS